jgi:hypothetical protein
MKEQTQTSPTKIRFDFLSMSWQGLTVEQIELWESLYDQADVIRILKLDIPRWLDKQNGKKITRKKNWRAFICNWLKREQIKAVGL